MTDPHDGRAPTPAACRFLTPDDPCWPPLWRPLEPPPAGVWAHGDPRVLLRPCVGIVGTRRPTTRGIVIARTLARQLAAAGWVVASGLARGIDAAAHRGALEGGGWTVAVMATGSDLCYPNAHRGLLEEIRAQGCSLTQFPAGTPPLKHHFLERNQLLASLTKGVVVVEAPRRSGALNTAREALDAGREVLAVPGPVDVETSRGCHQLLRDGATLVESAADVLALLGPAVPGGAAGVAAEDTPEPPQHAGARWLYARLDLEGAARDELRRLWPGDESGFVEGLTVLEMAGLIRRLPGGRLARRLWSG